MTPPERTDAVSIIIANFNGRHHLERCLPALYATTAARFEVIVADNGSSDGSLEWLGERRPQVRVLPLGANLGFGEANRRGVAAGRGGYVASLKKSRRRMPGGPGAAEQTPGSRRDSTFVRMIRP